MYRSHTNGELTIRNLKEAVVLVGWVQRLRDKGFLIWLDLRDRYGITQLLFDRAKTPDEVFEKVKTLGREFVIQVSGEVVQRESKNDDLSTGEIEVLVNDLNIFNPSRLPPFTIEDETDGGEEIRMKYRYLDIRRRPIKNNLIFRHEVSLEVRNYLSKEGFIEVETPYLIKSTPEGARDFIVPSRLNKGQFYALPQSPQMFKQLLMIGCIDRYFQIAKCFRDEDLRADRQPEFTQIDCEMAFVDQEDVLNLSEGLIRHLISRFKNVEIGKFPRITYEESMRTYGTDKPDIRFGMKFGELNNACKHREFKLFNEVEFIAGIAVPDVDFTRKEIDELIAWVKSPQVGASGMVWVKYLKDATFKSSVDTFYSQEDLREWARITCANPGDLICILFGTKDKTRVQLSLLRMEIAERLNFRKINEFAPVWVIDFPLLEWDEDASCYHAMHHPFTSPKREDIRWFETNPGKVRASAYDLVLNGNEIGGGSIRIHDRKTQELMFQLLGIEKDEIKKQFGFLIEAFQYGAPPHGGIAFGLDRLLAILSGKETIRDFIAFPKNSSGRDVMIDAPSFL